MLNTKMIGNKIAEARKKINLSQAGLARRLFISSQAVGKWERGESMPDIITLTRLAEILGVDLNYFSTGIQPMATEMTTQEFSEQHPAGLASGMQKKHNWNMSRGNWVDADFSGLKNLNEKFSTSNMQRCKFIGSKLSGLILKGNNIDGCDFSASDIRSSQFMGSYLINNRFDDCSLKDAEFSESHIKGCDFSRADLTEATFKSSSCLKNTMKNAMLNRTSFIATEMNDIVFDGTLEDCSFENCAFKNVTFQDTTLINTFFKNKSLKGVRFINCRADRMTYEFLKNGNADLTGITVDIDPSTH